MMPIPESGSTQAGGDGSANQGGGASQGGEAANAADEARNVRLQVRVLERTWIRALADGDEVFSGSSRRVRPRRCTPTAGWTCGSATSRACVSSSTGSRSTPAAGARRISPSPCEVARSSRWDPQPEPAASGQPPPPARLLGLSPGTARPSPTPSSRRARSPAPGA